MGRYHLLERLIKIVVVAFTILILVAVVMAVSKLDITQVSLAPPELNLPTILFVIALAGFMPTPMEASVLQSLWVRAKSEEMGRKPTPDEARFDFNLGFTTSILLAICFLVLGAVVIDGNTTELEASAGGFAVQLIGLFTAAIGEWFYALIGIIAVTVMLSTLLTVVDGYPRIAQALVHELRSLKPENEGQPIGSRSYDLAVIGICISAALVIGLFMKSCAAFIDLASVMVFLIGPIVAFLNHRAVFSGAIETGDQPGKVFKVWSVTSILFMALVRALYL